MQEQILGLQELPETAVDAGGQGAGGDAVAISHLSLQSGCVTIVTTL